MNMNNMGMDFPPATKQEKGTEQLVSEANEKLQSLVSESQQMSPDSKAFKRFSTTKAFITAMAIFTLLAAKMEKAEAQTVFGNTQVGFNTTTVNIPTGPNAPIPVFGPGGNMGTQGGRPGETKSQEDIRKTVEVLEAGKQGVFGVQNLLIAIYKAKEVLKPAQPPTNQVNQSR